MSNKKNKDAAAEEKVAASTTEAPEVKTEETPIKESKPAPKKTVVEQALSEGEKKALRDKAREMAKKNAKKKAEDDFLAAEVKKAELEENAKYGISTEEEIVTYTVNLPEAADRHIINGKEYLHGSTYEVPKSLADVMRDTEHRGHVQEDIRKGRDRNEYGFRERNGIKSGKGVATA
jgi:hypothetical protein